MLAKIVRIALILLLLAAAALAGAGVRLLLTLDRVAAAMPATLDRAVEREADRTRATAEKLVTNLSGDLEGEIAALRRDLTGSLDRISGQAVQQIDLTRRGLDAQLTSANQTLARELQRTNSSLEQAVAITVPLKSAAEQVDAALPLFLDCDHNADCAFNRYVGTMRGIEQMSWSLGRSAPATAKSLEQTSRNVAVMTGAVANLTTRLTAPKPWYRKAGDFLLGGASLVRLLQ